MITWKITADADNDGAPILWIYYNGKVRHGIGPADASPEAIATWLDTITFYDVEN